MHEQKETILARAAEIIAKRTVRQDKDSYGTPEQIGKVIIEDYSEEYSVCGCEDRYK